MLFEFTRHSLEETSEGYIVTLYMEKGFEEEFADEFVHDETTSRNKILNESIMKYIKANLADIKIYLVRVMVGSLLLFSITMTSLETSLRPVYASYTQTEIQQAANYSSTHIILNSQLLELPQKAFVLDGVTYAPVREVCEALGADVEWNASDNTVTVKKESKIMKFKVGSEECYINGVKKTMPQSALVNSKTMVGLRFMSENFGFSVEWNAKYKVVLISSTGEFPSDEKIKSLIPSNTINYSQEDVYWLSRIVHAEASGEDYNGKLAVANVVLNRVKSSDFPSTIKEVIFDRNYGVQFEPTTNGEIYKEPSEESKKAAIEALNGKDNSKGTLYFLNPKKSSSNWIIKNRKYAFTIQNHDFYL